MNVWTSSSDVRSISPPTDHRCRIFKSSRFVEQSGRRSDDHGIPRMQAGNTLKKGLHHSKSYLRNHLPSIFPILCCGRRQPHRSVPGICIVASTSVRDRPAWLSFIPCNIQQLPRRFLCIVSCGCRPIAILTIRFSKSPRSHPGHAVGEDLVRPRSCRIETGCERGCTKVASRYEPNLKPGLIHVSYCTCTLYVIVPVAPAFTVLSVTEIVEPLTDTSSTSAASVLATALTITLPGT